MTEEDRWDFLVALDNDLLQGGVILSEWCSVIVREADAAFAKGAALASILTAVSGIETYLRSESENDKARLVDLINTSGFPDDLKADLHSLRQYRNRWVHVDSPWDDDSLLESPGEKEAELENMARFAARTLRRTIYQNPWL